MDRGIGKRIGDTHYAICGAVEVESHRFKPVVTIYRGTPGAGSRPIHRIDVTAIGPGYRTMPEAIEAAGRLAEAWVQANGSSQAT